MIVFPILATPLALLVAAVDTYLIITAAYLLLRHFAIDFPESRHHILRRLIEGPVKFTGKRLTAWRGREVPPWVPWATVFIVSVFFHIVTVGLIAAMS